MKNRDQMSRPDEDRPTRGQGTWIIRPRRVRKHHDQMRLPLDDVKDDVDVSRLSDEEFKELLRGDDGDIEINDLASVEDQTSLTEEESAALDRALQALTNAIKEVIDEMYPELDSGE